MRIETCQRVSNGTSQLVRLVGACPDCGRCRFRPLCLAPPSATP